MIGLGSVYMRDNNASASLKMNVFKKDVTKRLIMLNKINKQYNLYTWIWEASLSSYIWIRFKIYLSFFIERQEFFFKYPQYQNC